MGKKENDIIEIEEIQNILNNYRIGKKPLSKLLGWGETTIIRYLEGDIPTLEYSTKLKTILENPAYYYQILSNNKSTITNIAYQKSKRAVLDKLLLTKIDKVAQYIINLYQAQISLIDLQGLLYYSQGFFLAFYDNYIFSEEYQVNSKGIPYLKLYNQMQSRTIFCLEIKEQELSKKEQLVIKAVVDAFSWYGPKMLTTLMAYERTLLRISRDKENNKIISLEAIKSYFKEVLIKYGIRTPEEIYKYPDKRIIDMKNV